MTTIQFSVKSVQRRVKCAPGSFEFKLTGTIGSNSTFPGVKGAVKVIVCDAGGNVSNLGNARF